jgi:hypothetical protein
VVKTVKIENRVLSGVVGDERIQTDKWPDPPHVYFANLRIDDPKAVETFIRQYGPPSEVMLKWVGGVKPSWLHKYESETPVSEDDFLCWAFDMFKGVVEGEFRLTIEDLMTDQNLLRLAWRGDDNVRFLIRGGRKMKNGFEVILPSKINSPARVVAKAEEALTEEFDAGDAGITGTQPIVTSDATIATHDLWRFICFLFWMDFNEGRTAVCRNRECPAPYFLRSRKDKQFCSHACAVAVNVRRFREREAEKKSIKRTKQEAK